MFDFAKYGIAFFRYHFGGMKSASKIATKSLSVDFIACFKAPALYPFLVPRLTCWISNPKL